MVESDQSQRGFVEFQVAERCWVEEVEPSEDLIGKKTHPSEHHQEHKGYVELVEGGLGWESISSISRPGTLSLAFLG